MIGEKFLSAIFIAMIFVSPRCFADSALEKLSSAQPLAVSTVHQLTLLAYSAQSPLAWDSPGQLVRSVFWNTVTLKTHPLAHADVYLQCKGQAPMLSGMSRVKTWSTYKDVLFGSASLDMLTAVFPGKLLENETVLDYLKPAIAAGHVRAISFSISSANCQRLMNYYSEYKKREYHKKYSGFTSNVYAGEGAGCAAYAMSFLHVAGLLENTYREAWSRQLAVPSRLMERTKSPPSLWSYLFGVNESWAGSGSGNGVANDGVKTLLIYDPEKMFSWLDTQIHQPFLSPIEFDVFPVAKAAEILVEGVRSEPSDDYWSYQWPY